MQWQKDHLHCQHKIRTDSAGFLVLRTSSWVHDSLTIHDQILQHHVILQVPSQTDRLLNSIDLA